MLFNVSCNFAIYGILKHVLIQIILFLTKYIE